MSEYDLTLEEKEKILIVAESLIHEPEGWVQGNWRCPVVELDKDKKAILDAGGNYIQAKSPNGQPLYQYCIEGAVNQAAINVLGHERAQALDSARYEGGDLIPKGLNDSSGVTRILGLDAIADELYGSTAMEFNDCERDDVDDEEEKPLETHKGVLKILRTRLAQIRKELR